MTDFKLYGKCETCPRKAFFVRKRVVPVPQLGSITAKSKKLMCGRCYRKVLTMLNKNDATD